MNSLSLLDRAFRWVLRLCLTLSLGFPKTVVSISVILAAWGGYLYFFDLPILTDRDQLLNSELELNRLRQVYREKFGDDRYLVLVVTLAEKDSEGGLPSVPGTDDRDRMKQVARAWVDQLSSRPDLFPKVVDRMDWAELRSSVLLYLPEEDFKATTSFLDEHMPSWRGWLEQPSLQSLAAFADEVLVAAAATGEQERGNLEVLIGGLEEFLRSVNGQLQSELRVEEARLPEGSVRSGTVQQESLHSVVERFRRELVFEMSRGRMDAEGSLFFAEGRILTVFADVRGDPGRQNRYAEGVEFAQARLDEVMASHGTGLEAGLAGFPALEYEEMRTGLKDISRGTLITLVLVTVLFIWGFRSLIRPLLAVLCLCLSLGMTCLLVWILVGHLNLIAMVFAIIMVAVGIDFAIHVTTHYERYRWEGRSAAEAIESTMFSLGGAIWLGGITTAAAFFSAYFTEFRGLSELGLISGAGLLICIPCMCIVYPALLQLTDREEVSPADRLLKKGAGRYQLSVGVRPWKVTNLAAARALILVAAVLVALSYSCGQYHVDTNLLNLQEEDGEANRWQRLLLTTDDVATFGIAIFQNRAELEEARERLESSELVRRTESLYPLHEQMKRNLLEPVCAAVEQLEPLEESVTDLSASRRQVWNLRQRIRRFGSRSQEAQTHLKGVETELASLYRTLGALSSEHHGAGVNSLDRELHDLSAEMRTELRSAVCPPLLDSGNLPSLLVDRFLGKDGSLALFVYAKKNVWNQDELEEFVDEVRGIVPDIFGEVISFYENGRSLINSFLQSALYALLAIVLLLLLWSRSIRTTLLVISPLTASVGLLLGLMKWGPYDVPWNYANFFALPILIGIGVDSGIHLVRAWNSGIPLAFSSASKAVLLSSLTTTIGFGVLATSDHVGVSSLGYILFWGILFSLICSLLLLPTLLGVFARRTYESED